MWLLVSVFGGLITTVLNGFFTPAAGASADTVIGNAQLQEFVSRLMPSTLYQEVIRVILDPTVNARDVTVPSTIGQYTQAQQQISSVLSLGQSLLLVWPQLVALVALAVACFVGAYIAFMRQEVRA